MRILLVEDEQHLSEAVAYILKKNHYTVDTVYDGQSGLDYAQTGIYDLIILDIMLPVMDGIQVLQTLRRSHLDTPVLLLSAKSEIQDKVQGLDSGADDYLAKPFSTDELLARIRALTRRKGEIAADNNLTFGDITLIPSTMTLSRGNLSVNLTQKEFQVLEHLIRRGNMISPKEQIIEKLWGFDSDAEANHVEVYVSFLRKKLNFVKSNVTIHAVRGVGYVLKA
ncbi:response regulator transcription factor [Ructibacterium gallinarum]|uniref:Stage 0 sporulation protein A homolog n=1 Tax=Ructibacterium gallinarum TaxID=2779355 RepID=A0A9D5LYX3_9FIRM|nr:response regulator transcription factor [Ructibacterium gallinarum]MBE5039472.1 response regulator transcription factor [Ructibacterium gallinarum]